MTSHEAPLCIVPARGGSRGVPRKNLQGISGRPLIAYTLEAVRAALPTATLVVSTDDEEIASWAEPRAIVIRRPAALATPDATIAEVAAHTADQLDWVGDVALFQPTSPIRSVDTIRAAVERFADPALSSLATVVREHHLFWYEPNGELDRAEPLFAERVNRQYARHGLFRETGSIQLVRARFLRDERRMVSPEHLLFELAEREAIDIDTVDDLASARRQMSGSTVVFRFTANHHVGSGHLHHCLRLADELGDVEQRFLLKDCDSFASQLLEERGRPFTVEDDLAANLADLRGAGPAVLVNDVLDTTEDDVLVPRRLGYTVVNIEDLGAGRRFADWVVNALYRPDGEALANVSTGSRFATLRHEFLDPMPAEIRDPTNRVLITFGGTDPSRLTERITRALAIDPRMSLHVVLGSGVVDVELPEGVVVERDVRSMAAAMREADVIVTSAGRTVYEAAAVGTPVVVLGQNAREATHAHLGYETGVIFLGLGALVDEDEVLRTVSRLLDDPTLRAELGRRLRASIDLRGAERIAARVRSMLEGLE